jgi:hypothetical protein
MVVDREVAGGHVHERVRVRVGKTGTQQHVNNVRLSRGAWPARPGKSKRAIVHFHFAQASRNRYSAS